MSLFDMKVFTIEQDLNITSSGEDDLLMDGWI